jgi:CRP-like cAMP-binding protein
MRRRGEGRGLATAAPQLQDNRVLAALPREATERLLPYLEPVTLARGAILYAPGQASAYLYFPTTTIVSLVYTMTDGTTAEIGLAGNEGVVGVARFLGGATMPHWAIVRIAGGAFRLWAPALQAEFQRGGAVQRALLRATQALLTQIAQMAVCNGVHPLAQRLCRWLLCIHDRVPTAEIPITHEGLGQILAARRESITLIAQHLQKAGVLGYHQGCLTILDRPGLEARVCECYQVVQDECTRLLG